MFCNENFINKNHFIFNLNFILFYVPLIRKLATNYWNCPIPLYSKEGEDDYSTAKSECGKKVKKKVCTQPKTYTKIY